MEAIDTKAKKDAVSQKYGFKTFSDMIAFVHRHNNQDKAINTICVITNEVISEVAKQVAERQRKLCSNEYKKQKNGFWININNNILNCDSPEII